MRIFAAERAGDARKVTSLQKLMLRSRANTLLSVRRVTQQNAGRATAGVDGKVALTSRQRSELAVCSKEVYAALDYYGVETALEMGDPLTPGQTEEVGGRPLLRCVQHRPGRPVAVRRP